MGSNAVPFASQKWEVSSTAHTLLLLRGKKKKTQKKNTKSYFIVIF